MKNKMYMTKVKNGISICFQLRFNLTGAKKPVIVYFGSKLHDGKMTYDLSCQVLQEQASTKLNEALKTIEGYENKPDVRGHRDLMSIQIIYNREYKTDMLFRSAPLGGGEGIERMEQVLHLPVEPEEILWFDKIVQERFTLC